MGTKYRNTHKSEHGAFWDGCKAVRTITTDDPKRAERRKNAGHKVEEIGEAPKKQPQKKKTAAK